LRLTAEEYATLVEQAPILIWRAGTDALCNYFNGRWLEFRGRTMEQEWGNGWAEGVHPEDFARCLQTYLEAFGLRHTFEMEYRLRRADGEYRWIFDRGVPYLDERGAFAGYIGSCIDITEQVEARRELQEARERELADLRGLLPICAQCKKIRREDGEWEQLESYIHGHSRADFTHSLCPGCFETAVKGL
jgi:PAS domain S-box-containing protein